MLTFLFIVALAGALGCNPGDGSGDKKDTTLDFSFAEASQGLPSNGLWREHLGFHDMNGDGHMDILATPPRTAGEKYKGPVIWYGNGEGVWRETVVDGSFGDGLGYGSITAADFDGDGIPDMALAIHGKGLMALRGAKDGTYGNFSDGFPSAATFISRALLSGDFDGDGRSEIAAVSEGPFGGAPDKPSGIWTCSWESGKWTCAPVCADESLRKGLFADEIVSGDVNGDGKTDLAIASLAGEKSLIVWINEGGGRFVPFNKGLPQEKAYFSVALTDMNQDGRADLVAYIQGFGRENYVGMKAFLSRESGFEDISQGLPVKEAFKSIAAGDMNHDGTVEILGGTRAGGVKMFYRKGDRWQTAAVKGLPTEGMQSIRGIYCIDLNGDGYEDIAVNYASSKGDKSGGIRVFLNTTGKKNQTN